MSTQQGFNVGSLTDTFQTEAAARNAEILAAIAQRNGAIPWVSRISHRVGRNLGRLTVAQLVALGGAEGDQAFALDGRKVGETTGNGTGAECFFSGGLWRTPNNDATVLS